jgi:small subunit ribosomal protein S17
MFRRKKKDEKTTDTPTTAVAREEESAAEAATPGAAMADAQSQISPGEAALAATSSRAGKTKAEEPAGRTSDRGNRVQKVGIVSSDKMQKTVVVRVDRLVLHQKYRRYVRRTSRFMAHDDLGSSIGDRVRIVETRPLSARKRWRVVEILQKAAK